LKQLYRNLPADLFILVTEFLAGDHAFDTIANLNVTCKHLHKETLPVLYETLLMEKFAQQPTSAETAKVLPEGVKYTKSVCAPLTV
jgi:hypothetical protein